MRLIRFVVFLCMTSMTVTAFGQNKEVNPNIDSEWRFIKSQELSLLSGSFYSFEFPAEKGYDYIFNLSHELKAVYVAISVYDLQDKPIEDIVVNESNTAANLQFDVKSSGTYVVIVGVTDPSKQKGASMPSHFNLIRRVKI
jgi:hypothetical protein